MKKRAWMAPVNQTWEALSHGERQRRKAHRKKAGADKLARDAETARKNEANRQMDLALEELIGQARAEFPFVEWEVFLAHVIARSSDGKALAVVEPGNTIVVGRGPARILSAIEDFQEKLDMGMWPSFLALLLAHQNAVHEQAEIESLISPVQNKNKTGGRL